MIRPLLWKSRNTMTGGLGYSYVTCLECLEILIAADFLPAVHCYIPWFYCCERASNQRLRPNKRYKWGRDIRWQQLLYSKFFSPPMWNTLLTRCYSSQQIPLYCSCLSFALDLSFLYFTLLLRASSQSSSFMAL